MILYTPVLTAIVAIASSSSSSHGSVENVWGVLNLQGCRVGYRTPSQEISSAVSIFDTVSFKLQHRHHTAVSTASNEYEEVLAKYPRPQDSRATGSSKSHGVRSFAYSPALQSRRIRA